MSELHDHQEEASIFEQAMKQALSHLDKVRDELRAEQEKVIDLEMAAKDELSRIKREAEALAGQHFDQKLQQYIADLKHDLHKQIITKLILAEIPSIRIQKALELKPGFLVDVWMDIGFDKINERHIGHVGFDSRERSGDVILYLNHLTTRFPFEFGRGDAVAVITIPEQEHWLAQTGIPLEDREDVLRFVAERILRDRAFGCKYFIGPADIIIMHP